MSYYKNDEQTKLYSQLVARAWSDPNFKEALKEDPKTTLAKEFGIEVPEDMNLQVRENNSEVFYLTLSDAPASKAASLEVDELAASSTFGSLGCLGTAGSACGTFGTAACLGTAGSWEL